MYKKYCQLMAEALCIAVWMATALLAEASVSHLP